MIVVYSSKSGSSKSYAEALASRIGCGCFPVDGDIRLIAEWRDRERYAVTFVADGETVHTATAFEGCDIFDPDGMNIIVSNTSIPHTILDIQSTFIQVCGRLRDSKRKNEVLYIFNVLNSTLSYEEQKTKLEEEHCADHSFYKELNQLSEGNRERVLRLIKLSNNNKLPKYLIINDKTIFEIDTELYRNEIWKTRLQHLVFKDKKFVQGECERCNMEVIANDFQYMKLTYSEKLLERIKESKANISNKDLFEAYHSLREESRNTLINMNPREEYEKIESYKPKIKKYYDTLGIDEIRRLDYKIDKLETAFIKKKNLPKNIQLVEIFTRGIQYGKEYTSPEITEKVKEICSTHELPRISNKELKRIKEYVRKHNIKPHLNIMLNADIDITCPFRNEREKKCDIYEVRPWVCQKFICSNAKISTMNITKKQKPINQVKKSV